MFLNCCFFPYVEGNTVLWRTCVCLGIILGSNSLWAADPPAVKDVLRFKPVQKDVEIDTPEPAEYDKCRVTAENQGKSWSVTGPQGQTVRRFADTNGDNVVDQWRYYNRGVEVYRDIDSNFNKRPDQARWLNFAGSRWSIDSNEDGKIDGWKSISAEEVSREAIRAMVTGDVAILQQILVTKADLNELGISPDLSGRILTRVADPATKLKKAIDPRTFNQKTNWVKFDTSHPNTIPADQIESKSDVVIYDHAMAIVETGEGSALIHLGEMVKVGDAWKLTRIPRVFDPQQEDNEPGLFGPTLASTNTGNDTNPTTGESGISPEIEKLLKDLQELDTKIPTPTATRREQDRYHQSRNDLIVKLISASKEPEDREQWTRQLADGLAVSVQLGGNKDSLNQLEKLKVDIAKAAPKTNLAAYIAYRHLLASFSTQLQSADEPTQKKIQAAWIASLTSFVEDYPQAEDAPEAMWQLATTLEFGGKTSDARDWYSQLASAKGDLPAKRKAQGALKRIDLKGKTLDLSGPSLDSEDRISLADYKGKVVLVIFWATWVQPLTDDIPQIRAAYEQYHDQGFEIIGINLDSEKERIAPFVKENRIKWVQIHEEGGLDSPLSESYGVISLPTMFLVDQNGKVVDRGVQSSDLKTMLSDLLK